MKEHHLTAECITAYTQHLREEERADATIQKYLLSLRRFAAWLDGRPVTKENTAQWKAWLQKSGQTPSAVNGSLSAINGLFTVLGWGECRVRLLRLQRRAFREAARELTRQEYRRLVDTAVHLRRERTALLMETICAAGLRVSEVKYITKETAQAGRATISLKGKVRIILLPKPLCRKLLRYAQKQKIASGELFLTRDGKSLSRNQIWREMKALCTAAGVARSKVFPHNLRHLFATTYYQACRDIVRLADVLGHSSINTTRIYLLTTGEEHARDLERLGLVQ